MEKRSNQKKILMLSLIGVTSLTIIGIHSLLDKLHHLYDLFSDRQAIPDVALKQYKLETDQSEFLRHIAQESGLSPVAHITVCSLKKECRNLRGDQEPESVASLIKVPIAEVLLYKIVTEKVNLQTPIYLDPDNFTEDSSLLEVETYYPLGRLLAETIINSSNMAPNQLIDYMGWEYMNQVLEKQGYKKTWIASKFAGETTMPLGSEDWGKNSLTSNELTAMMVRIYNSNSPGDKYLVRLLEKQHDREFGFAALQGSQAKWLGEKTGQNSLAIGTTVAMQIQGKIYILTVIDDGEYTDVALRKAIRKLADYMATKGSL